MTRLEYPRLEYRCSINNGEARGAGIAIAVDRILPDSKEPQGLEIKFRRTIRVPDSGEVQNLPPSLGLFKLYKVHDYASSVPKDMLKKGGLFFPMYQKEALWIQFKANAPFMIKIYCGGVNVVSGEHSDENAETKKRRMDLAKEGKLIQDYVVVPKQPWIDGVAVKPSVVRQFVAMPIGHDYSVEAQFTGEETVGGLQFEITPALCYPKDRLVREPGIDIDINIHTGKSETIHVKCSPDDQIQSIIEQICDQQGIQIEQHRLFMDGGRLGGGETLRQLGFETGSMLDLYPGQHGGGPRSSSEDRKRMGIAAGGMIKQDIRKDTYDSRKWIRPLTLNIPVHILDSLTFREVTGLEPPPCPIDAQTYASAGLAYFDLYEESPADVSGAEAFGNLRSINELDTARNRTKASEAAVHPRVVRLTDDGNGHVYEVKDPDGLLDPHGTRREFRTLHDLEAEMTPRREFRTLLDLEAEMTALNLGANRD